MATVFLSPIGNAFQFFDANGVPLDGGFLNTYLAGTSTPQATYANSLGTIANSTSITLNSDGRMPNEVWLVSGLAYKFVLTDSASNLLGTYDNLTGINDPFVSGFAPVTGTFTPTMSFGGGTTGITYSARAGQYVQFLLPPGGTFASLVYYWVEIVLSSKGASTGAAKIGGLPFTVSASLATSANAANGSINASQVTFADKVLTLAPQPGAALIAISSTPGGGGAGPNFIDDTGFANTSALFGSGFYPV